MSNNSIKAFLSSLIFPTLVWVRETLVRLSEVDFASIPDFVLQQLRAYASMLPGTKAVEDSIGHTKSAAEAILGTRVSPTMAWHSVATGGIVSDLGWVQPPITKAALSCATGKVPMSVHRGCDSEFSLGSDVLQELQGDAGWCNASPARRRLAASAWRLAVTLSGDWSNMSAAWLGLLVEPGMMLHREGQAGAMLVFGVTQYGLWARRARLIKVNDEASGFYVDVFGARAATEDPFCFVVVTDLQGWRVVRVTVVPPVEVPSSMSDTGVRGLVLQAQARGTSLLRAAAQTGFRHLTVFFMKKLVSHLRLRFDIGAYPRTEPELVTALFRYVMPTASPEDLALAMQQRDMKDHSDGGPFCHEADGMVDENEDLMGQVCGSDAEEVSKGIATACRRRASRRPPASARLASGGAAASSSSSAAVASEVAEADVGAPGVADQPPYAPFALAPGGGGLDRPVVNPRRLDWESIGLDRASVQHLKPPGCVLGKDDSRFMCWTGRFPGRGRAPVCVTKAWGPRTGLTERQCLVYVLQTLWGWYSDKTGYPCPWSWDSDA